jgi:hypothetical protein
MNIFGLPQQQGLQSMFTPGQLNEALLMAGMGLMSRGGPREQMRRGMEGYLIGNRMDEKTRKENDQRAALQGALDQDSSIDDSTKQLLLNDPSGRLTAAWVSNRLKPKPPKEYGFEEVDGRLIRTDPLMGTAEPVYGSEPGPDVKGEMDVRKEFNSLKTVKDYNEIERAFATINSITDSAAGDMGLIFSYMKILDPGSTVREGEYASAENARGVPEYIRGIYNRVTRGERLTKDQRADFRGQAENMYSAARWRMSRELDRYGPIIESGGYDSSRILPTLPTMEQLGMTQSQLNNPNVTAAGVRWRVLAQ